MFRPFVCNRAQAYLLTERRAGVAAPPAGYAGRPGLANLLVVLLGWLLCPGPVHTITEALVASGVAGQCHHEAFHRLFSRGAWSPDTVVYALLRHL